jgi:hypothetical protein
LYNTYNEVLTIKKKCFHHSDAPRALNYRNKIINWRNHKQIQINYLIT